MFILDCGAQKSELDSSGRKSRQQQGWVLPGRGRGAGGSSGNWLLAFSSSKAPPLRRGLGLLRLHNRGKSFSLGSLLLSPEDAGGCTGYSGSCTVRGLGPRMALAMQKPPSFHQTQPEQVETPQGDSSSLRRTKPRLRTRMSQAGRGGDGSEPWGLDLRSSSAPPQLCLSDLHHAWPGKQWDDHGPWCKNSFYKVFRGQPAL